MEIGKKQRDPKKSLSRQVVDSIEEMIMERKLGPGDVLPTEIQISEELQVSKSSVREAIKMLEALGVVEIRRGLCTVMGMSGVPNSSRKGSGPVRGSSVPVLKSVPASTKKSLHTTRCQIFQLPFSLTKSADILSMVQ